MLHIHPNLGKSCSLSTKYGMAWQDSTVCFLTLFTVLTLAWPQEEFPVIFRGFDKKAKGINNFGNPTTIIC